MSENEHIHTYARWQPIYDVVGRRDYLTNPDRQENLLAVSGENSPEFWKYLSEDAQQAWRESGGSRNKTVKRKDHRTGQMIETEVEKRACEALEIQVSLPRKILDYSPAQQQHLLNSLVQFLREQHGIVSLAALHLSKTENNAHAHILYPERTLLPEPLVKKAVRNIFLDEQGFRKRTKKEILDPTGNLRSGCKIIPKGAVIHVQHFGDKDPLLSSRSWVHTCKEDLTTWINDTLEPDKKRKVFDPADPYLAQEHVGKGVSGRKRTKIENYNDLVKTFNLMIIQGALDTDVAHQIKTRVMVAPQRTNALAGALAGLLLERPELKRFYFMTSLGDADAYILKELALTGFGGKRTQQEPDAAAKEQLRSLYKAAEQNRQLARAATSDLDRQMYRAKARKCSMMIDYQRRKLGLYTDPDYSRRLSAINNELDRINRHVSSCRAAVDRIFNKRRWIKHEIQTMQEELNNLPIFFQSKKTHQREQQLKDLIKNAEKQLVDLDAEYKQRYAVYYFAVRDAKTAREELSLEREGLKAERRQLKIESRKEKFKDFFTP